MYKMEVCKDKNGLYKNECFDCKFNALVRTSDGGFEMRCCLPRCIKGEK